MAQRRKTQDAEKITHFDGLIREFQGESDRSAASVATSFLDARLGRYIASFLIDDPGEVNKLLGIEWSGIESPLGTFSARIRAAYCLGLLRKEHYDDLHT